MTGRELAAAIRPLEQWAAAMSRFSQIAQEAIRLEEGLAQRGAKLVEVNAAVKTAQADLARLQAESQALGETMAAERKAAEEANTARALELMATAEQEVEKQKQAAKSWALREREAAAQHAAQMKGWQAEESALREHIDGLRDLAQRLATAAGAVLR